MSGRRRVGVFNVGLALVAASTMLPWARVAGATYHGFGFADLLLRLPELRPLGDHLKMVAVLWFTVPAAAQVAWGTQFLTWPSRPGGPGPRLAVAVQALALGAVTGWLARRDVGFPAAGPVVAIVGTALAVAGAWVPASRRDGASSD